MAAWPIYKSHPLARSKKKKENENEENMDLTKACRPLSSVG